MISKECFVYIPLPKSFDTVTVGKFTWEKAGAHSEVGTFIYGKSYLKNKHAISLDPFNLPLEEREFQVTTNEGVHGPIRDASPDRWGRYVIQKNTPSDQHDPVGYLLNSAGDRIGALSFGFGKVPPAPVRRFNKAMDLEKLIEAAHKKIQKLSQFYQKLSRKHKNLLNLLLKANTCQILVFRGDRPLALYVVYMLHSEMWKLNLGVFASMKLKTAKDPLKNGSKT